MSWLGLISVQQWDDVVVMISCRDLGQGQILQSGRHNHRQNHVQHRSFGSFTTTTNNNMYYLILQSRGHNNNNNTSICENKLSIIVNYNPRQHCCQYQCTALASRDLLKWTRKMRKNIKYYWDHVTRSFTKPQLPSIQIHPNNPALLAKIWELKKKLIFPRMVINSKQTVFRNNIIMTGLKRHQNMEKWSG